VNPSTHRHIISAFHPEPLVVSVMTAAKNAASDVASTVSDAASAAVAAVSSNVPPAAPYVDDAPEQDQNPVISPKDEVAKEKLDKFVASRPDPQELVDKNILKSLNVAPALQANQAKLERSQLEDKLDQKLQARPSPQELVKEGILQENEVPPV